MRQLGIGLCMALAMFLANVTIATSAASKPVVTINIPVAGSEYLYQSDIPVSVTVESQGETLAGEVMASIDGGSGFSLDFDPKNHIWAILLSELPPGNHVLSVSATNPSGTVAATSSFRVFVNFGQWLPPLAGGSTQARPGSTFPVRFTLLGANGPLDNSDINPEVQLDDTTVGQALSVVDEATGLPYFQLPVKLPKRNCQISIDDPDIKQGKQTQDIIIK